jgi:ubiquinone/menaquinone biosynthesis C-methylase UbiE
MSWLSSTIYDRFMRKSEDACLRAWRAELLLPLAGKVLEVGAGTGANAPLYGDAVTRLVLCEPDPRMRRQIAPKLPARLEARTEIVDASLARLPFDDASFDVVVATLVLCTVVEPRAALAEIRRVLRPGGLYVFLEHVASDDAARLTWQRRLEPAWRIVADGCHVTRRTEASIRDAGFAIDRIERESVRKALPILRPSIRGVARAS